MTDLNTYALTCHAEAVNLGWWEDEDRNFGELIALIHSEASEAFEEYRNGASMTATYYSSPGNTKPEGIPSELADILIRVFDVAGRHNIDLESAVAEKLIYNATRGHRHGGKRA